MNLLLKKSRTKKKSKPKEEHSENKPDIKKGIKKVDLQHHFNREELEQFLRKKKDDDPEALKDMKVTGRKNELVDRILKFLEGDIEGVKKKERRQRKT